MAAAAAVAAGVAQLDETLEMKDFITKSSGGDVAATSSPNLPLHGDVCVFVCVCRLAHTLDGVSGPHHPMVFGYFPLIAIACPKLRPLFVFLSPSRPFSISLSLCLGCLCLHMLPIMHFWPTLCK